MKSADSGFINFICMFLLGATNLYSSTNWFNHLCESLWGYKRYEISRFSI